MTNAKKMLGAILISHEDTSSSAAESVDSSLPSPPDAQGHPPALDWRDNGGDFTTPVRDQGQCGSCWAFAALGAFESRMEIAYNNPSINPDFAEQDLVSCAGCGGCSGATMPCPLNWILDSGVMNESCYPYVGKDTSCNPGCSRYYRISEWHGVTPLSNENAIKEALTRGPVVGTFNVYTDFYYYESGIYEYTWGILEGGHGIVIVGWGQDERGTYWICKNSWGTGWGEGGWFKIRSGNCGINDELYELSVTPPAPPVPQVDFIGTPAQGIRPLAVQFTDLSTNSPTSWNWTFGDDSANATVQNPAHTYTAAGSYTVTLTATNSFGSNTTQKSNYITVTPPPPFLPDWSYRKLHTISGSSVPLTDYQVRFKLWNTTGTDTGENVYLGNNVTPDFRDIRFTTTDNTVLPYWVQETGSNYAVVWVRIPSIPTTGTQVYLYYGNPSATSQSNGDDTFLFFDDFSESAINSTKWQVVNPTGWSLSSGALIGTNAAGQLKSIQTFNSGVSLHTRIIRTSSPPTNGYTLGGFWKSTSNGLTILDHPAPKYYRNNGDWVSGSGELPASVWEDVQISSLGSMVSFQVRRVDTGETIWNVSGISNTVQNESLLIGGRGDGASYPGQTFAARWDWIFIRKFVALKPSHSTWSNLEVIPAIQSEHKR